MSDRPPPSIKPYAGRAIVYSLLGFGLYYAIGDRGNEVMKDKMRKERPDLMKELDRKEALIAQRILGGGASDLSALREQTTQKRRQMAEEYYKKQVEEVKAQQQEDSGGK